MQRKVGVVGLGAMGRGVATSLLRAGFDVFVKDLGLVQQIVRSANFSAVLAERAFGLFQSAADAGHGADDDTAGSPDVRRRPNARVAARGALRSGGSI
jgi:3-hydroxyisobutyrate dehydrogenase-like beta-hydroxyacid dehydrogenase